jgi:hypothetical protein
MGSSYVVRFLPIHFVSFFDAPFFSFLGRSAVGGSVFFMTLYHFNSSMPRLNPRRIHINSMSRLAKKRLKYATLRYLTGTSICFIDSHCVLLLSLIIVTISFPIMKTGDDYLSEDEIDEDILSDLYQSMNRRYL